MTKWRTEIGTAEPDLSAEALATRLFTSALGTMDLLHLYIGKKLGLYALMASVGALTAPDLASRAGMHPRYAREWLEQQAVTGLLVVEDIAAPTDQRLYRLPAGHAEALTDEESMNYLAAVAGMLVSIAQRMPELLSAYRTGDGLDWAAYGPDMWQGQAALNRPLFVKLLGQDYLPSIPELDEILRRPNAWVADLACGGGWSSIGIARAYPGVRVDGYDLDAPSIAQAASAAASADLADRVRFHATDAASLSEAERSYDLVTIFEALHDVPDPVGMLRAALKMLREGGVVLVMDERVADEFTAPGDDVERFMYGWSLTVCLPAGMSERPSAGTGTVMRRPTLESYAREAGFSGVEVLPVENDFFRFYLIRP
ncbi:MAG: methyltransferase domain-containing protein [Candidatus Dormibacteraeota bacterium]|nr:methyltransferase domain-containing protein [Candidatus Dormibacteraeota bacterium]